MLTMKRAWSALGSVARTARYLTSPRTQHVVAAAALASTVAFVPPALADRADDTLVAAFPREVTTVDGLYSTLRENDILGLLVDDALFYVDPERLEPVPLAAESYEFLDDTTLEVRLRDDITFHDGSPMTADDVVYSYEWTVSTEGETRYATRIGRWLDRVEAVDPLTVRFHMLRPYAMVLYDLAYYSKIRQRGAYDDPTADNGVNPDAQSLELNGTGPYRVVDFQPGQLIVLERYEGYRDDSAKGTPAIQNIRIRIIPDFATQAAEIMAGGVHWAFNVPTDIAEDVGRTGRAQFVAGPSMRVGYIVLDAMGRADPDGPLTQLAVRQAMNHAIDRDSLVDNLVRGTSAALHTACNPVQFGCTEDVTVYEHDPERARQLLAEAGYPDGIEFELWGARDREVLEAIIGMWSEAGIRASLRHVRGATLREARNNNDVVAYFGSSGSFSIPDAGAIIPDRFAEGSINYFHGDEELAQMVLNAVSTYDPDERIAHFDDALQRITEQAYWVPTHRYTQNFLISNDLSYWQSEDGMPRLFLAHWN